MMLLVLIRLTPCHRIGQHHLLLGQVGHAELLPAAQLLKIIEGRIHRQPVQPRLKDLFFPELVERKIQPQKHFLCDVLDIFRAGDQPRDRPQNALSDMPVRFR